MKAVLISNSDKPNYKIHTKKIIDILTDTGIEVLKKDGLGFTGNKGENILCDSEDKMLSGSDILIAVGGDGTIIRCAKLASRFGKPILGINTGRLGFVSDFEIDEIDRLKALSLNRYTLDSRMLLELDIEENGQKRTYYVLNDIYITRGATSQICEYKVSRKGNTVFLYRADGIIISTPTGSTAYSLSAGGPIVDTNLDCIIVTPVCAHSLISRPLILDSEKKLNLDYKVRKGSEIFVMADGNMCHSTSDDGTIEISRSANRVNFIRLSNEDIYTRVKKKLTGKEL